VSDAHAPGADASDADSSDAHAGEGERREALAREADALLAVAVEAATNAGALLLERVRRGAEREIASKSTPTDLVSEADLASERAIRELLAHRRPDDGFLGEEGARTEGSSGLSWVVDPLDGTVNFLFGIPQWCVSVAVRDSHGTVAGAVYDPNRDELFSATRHARPFAYDADVRAAQARVLSRVVPRVRDVRRFGSAALDLTWTAAGRYDAYFERTVKPWDIAAGALICERAGLVVLELPVHEQLPWGILVAAPALAQELLELVGGA